nr:lamin-like protein [Quercus suber]
MNVLEVNKTDYESCNSDNFLHNWTTGAGRDVVPLNVTRNYYFISGKGFCYGGMKLAIHVENLPPPPTSTPLDEKSSSSTLTSRGMIVLPMVLAIGAVWDAFLWHW